MARPFKIPVGLTEYKVRFKKRIPGVEDCQGLCEFEKKLISIQSIQDKDAQFLTFWHEFLHAAHRELGYDDMVDNESYTEAMSHAIARAIRALPGDFR